MTIKVGLIGVGKFGSVILDKLHNLGFVDVTWTCTTKSNWKDQSSVDWVIIATPDLFHFEQSAWFLAKGINVLCEKPATLSTKSLSYLYQLAYDSGVHFYVDDVYSYHSIPLVNSFSYRKYSPNNASNPIDRIAYHHFYLCTPIEDDYTISILSATRFSHDIVSFELQINSNIYKFEYDLASNLGREDSLHPYLVGSDALACMLEVVLSGKANYILNQKHSTFATQVSEIVKRQLYGSTAVVGAGIYGTTAALGMAYSGFTVDIFDSNEDLLSGASGINQYRVHRGYHYPRSPDTIISCKRNEVSFKKLFGESIVSNTQQLYAVSSVDSLITSQQFTDVLDEQGLSYQILDNLPNTTITLLAKEDLYDPAIMKRLVSDRLFAAGVNVHLSHFVGSPDDLLDFDNKIFATYRTLNLFVDTTANYQYELCEKPIFKLPPAYKQKGIVIMDGPFMCFDPFANTEYHVAGNVQHAIHASNTGKFPVIPDEYIDVLDCGIVYGSHLSKYQLFIDSARAYFPDIDQSMYIGSMFTFRVVLPNMDATDSRPTLVNFQDRSAYIFSGKIVNASESADRVIDYFTQLAICN